MDTTRATAAIVLAIALSIGCGAKADNGDSRYVIASYGDGNINEMPNDVAFLLFAQTVAPANRTPKLEDPDLGAYLLARMLELRPEYGGVASLPASDRQRVFELQLALHDASVKIETAARDIQSTVYCDSAITAMSSEEILDRLLLIDEAPVQTAGALLKQMKQRLDPTDRQRFEGNLIEKIPGGYSYTRIDNRYFIEPEMIGLTETQRIQYLIEMFDASCKASGG
ncbi:MAG: hypothetical protein AAF229_12335 [Pseudomonadota bacterium]